MEKNFDSTIEAVEEADNRYSEGWSRSKVVEFLKERYEVNEAQATAIVVAVENIRHGMSLKGRYG